MTVLQTRQSGHADTSCEDRGEAVKYIAIMRRTRSFANLPYKTKDSSGLGERREGNLVNGA